MTSLEDTPDRKGRYEEDKLNRAARLAAELLRAAEDTGDPELIAAARIAAFAAGIALARSLAPGRDIS